MLLAEAMGPEAFRERVKIYATDVDEEALNQARHAVYASARPRRMSRRRCSSSTSSRQEDRYVFNKDLRRSVIFGRHDLIQDAPISRVDLLICRNCLMYFNAEAQARILARFHFALVPAGVLFLGKAETLLAQSATFEPLDIKRRLFLKADRQPEVRHMTVTAPDGHDRARYLRDAASDAAPSAQLVVDRDGASCTPTSRSAPCSDSPRAIWAALCRTSSSPTDPSSCARVSSACTWNAARSPRRMVAGPVPAARSAPSSSWSSPCSIRRRPLGVEHPLPTFPASAGCRRRSSGPARSSRRPSRSSSRPTRSSRPPTRSCSPRSRSWRPRTRSSSPPTRSSRR